MISSHNYALKRWREIMTPIRNAFLTVAILLYACNTSYVQAEGGRKNNVPEKREAISMPDTSLRGTLDKHRLIVALTFDILMQNPTGWDPRK